MASWPKKEEVEVKRVVSREDVVARVEALMASGKVSASVVQRRLRDLLRAL